MAWLNFVFSHLLYHDRVQHVFLIIEFVSCHDSGHIISWHIYQSTLYYVKLYCHKYIVQTLYHDIVVHLIMTQCEIVHLSITHCKILHPIMTHCKIVHLIMTHCKIVHPILTHCKIVHLIMTHCKIVIRPLLSTPATI